MKKAFKGCLKIIVLACHSGATPTHSCHINKNYYFHNVLQMCSKSFALTLFDYRNV